MTKQELIEVLEKHNGDITKVDQEQLGKLLYELLDLNPRSRSIKNFAEETIKTLEEINKTETKLASAEKKVEEGNLIEAMQILKTIPKQNAFYSYARKRYNEIRSRFIKEKLILADKYETSREWRKAAKELEELKGVTKVCPAILVEQIK